MFSSDILSNGKKFLKMTGSHYQLPLSGSMMKMVIKLLPGTYPCQPVELSSTESPFESGSTNSQELLQSTSLAPDQLDQESATLTSEQISSATPVPTNTALTADTPHHSKLLNPVSLFPVNDVPSDQQEDMECEPSISVTPHEEDQGGISIDFNLHDSDDDLIPISNLQTKTAKLLYRAVGESSDLTELDNLRQALKEKNKQKGKKPSQQQNSTIQNAHSKGKSSGVLSKARVKNTAC